jgi:DNA mismatch repair ATPase MutS
MRDYHIVFGDDANLIALDIRKTSEALKESASGLVYVTLNDSQFAAEVREILLERQYRVQIHDKDEAGNWQLAHECSPGNWGDLSDILYPARSNLQSRGLAAVSHSDVRFAVVFADDIDQQIRISYFTDDVNLCTLESLLVQLGPNEVIFPQNCRLQEQIVEKLAMNQVLATPVCGKSHFVRDDVISSVRYLITDSTNLDELVRRFDSSKCGTGRRKSQSPACTSTYDV